MPKLNFIIISDSAEMSTEGKLNIYGIFDSIFSDDFPAIHSSLTITVNMEIEKGSHKESFKIKTEGGDVINPENESEFDVGEGKTRHQFVHNMKNLQFPEEGKYTVEAYVDGDLIGSTYFLVKRKEQ